MIVTEREREAETQAEGEAGSMHREPNMGFDPGSPGSHPGPKAGAKPLRHPGIPTPMFLAAMSTIAKLWKEPLCPSTEKWIKKLWSMYIMDYYSAIRKNEYPPFGIPGWRSGLAPAFGPGRDPGDLGSNPTSGSWCMEPASPSGYVSACVSGSVSPSISQE